MRKGHPYAMTEPHLFVCIDCLQIFDKGINATASYFGDKHLQPVEIERIVEAVFDDQEIVSHKGNSYMYNRKLLCVVYVYNYT